MTAPALRVEGLAVPFGEQAGLTGVAFEVGPAERLAVVGGSGAGKTTLLRAIAGLSPVGAGRVVIGGHDVTALPAERRDAVYLHQSPLLFPHLTAGENVAFPLRVRRVPQAEIVARVRDALAAVRLDGFAARAPRTLSGGQRHRVALARAVVSRPAVLLLDEPLSALDPALREEVRESLLALQRAYRPALVMVTHDLDDAGLLGDRIGVLLGGRLAQLARPEELFARPATLAVARLLGIPNVLPGIVRPGNRFESPLGTVALHGALAGVAVGPAVAVFRPDAAAPAPDGPLSARVTAVRHRARETTILATGAAVQVELPTGSDGVPAMGTLVRFGLRATAVSVFPGD
ncbi:MAG TPA: ABC transporter ATP-binding protein [Gemmatimonadales bacterium]|nr:ABC transporter ATP-binding protein [Gemmatimonadales bacterium]